MQVIRASSLTLVASCPAAAQTPSIPMKSRSPEADLGTATHDVVTKWILRGWQDEDLAQAADRYSVPLEELTRLAYWTWKRWEEMREFFPDPKTVDVDAEPWQFVDVAAGLTLTGHVDIYSILTDEIRILDFKTGRLDTSAEQQLKAYAFLAINRFLGENKEINSVYACALHTREGIVEGWRWDQADLLQWWGELKRQIKYAAYNPGRHCSYCPRAHGCPAHSRLVQFSIASLTEGIPSLPKDPKKRGRILAEVLDRAKVVESACHLARDAVRAEVAAAGGRLETEDGRELVLKAQTTKTIDFAAGEDVLRAALGDDFAECVTVKKTAVESCVRAQAGRGRKKQAVETLMGELQKAGAIREQQREVLELKRSLQKIGVSTDE